MTPKLSIIVPVYNTEKYLKECLDSLINQTFKDIEIIIVNDCSPDNSEAIIFEYMSNDPRIKYVKHDKNLGLGGARNTGITNATGAWITFVDSDDYIELNTYEAILSLMEKHQADLGVFSAINFNSITKKEKYAPYFDCDFNILTTLNHLNISNFRNITACTKIFKGSDIINNKLTFPEHLKHEDEEFWFKYVAAVEPSVISSNEKFYHYRQHSNSIMSNPNSILDLSQIFFNIYTFLKQHDLLENCKMTFIKYIQSHIGNWTLFIPLLATEDSVKFLQDIKNVLHILQLKPTELQDNLLIFYIYTTEQINDNSVLYISYLFQAIDKHHYLQMAHQRLQQDKYYKFGLLSKKQKIKKILLFFRKN